MPEQCVVDSGHLNIMDSGVDCSTCSKENQHFFD